MKTKLTRTAFFIYLTLLIILAYSVVYSGFFYQFDNDELINAQKVYLMLTGHKPFTSFFSVYSPILHWLLMPVFSFFGFSFQALLVSRLFMIVLFSIRLFLIFFFVFKIFGKKIAYLFTFLFLADPISVFTVMQIRTDNLAMIFYNAGLIIFYFGYLKSKKILLFLAGVLFGAALLSTLKIGLSLLVIVIIYAIYCLKNRTPKDFFCFCTGWGLSFLLFFFYFYIQNSLPEMVQQLFIDSVIINQANKSFSNFSFFYQPNNPLLYGFDGRPLTWLYSWVLLIFAFIGVYQVFATLLSQPTIKKTDFIKMILFLTLSLNWLSLFFINSVYIQYFLPAGWLLALFAAVSFNNIYSFLSRFKKLKFAILCISWAILVILTYFSVKGNFFRAKAGGFWFTKDVLITKMNVIGKDKAVFPNTLFHPLVGPFVYGYPLERMPEKIIKRYPYIPDILEEKKPPYLYFGEYNRHLRPEWESYIDSHYQQLENIPNYWIRIK